MLLKGLTQPNGVAFKDGALYVATIPTLLKYENIEANLDNPPAPKEIYDVPQGGASQLALPDPRPGRQALLQHGRTL